MFKLGQRVSQIKHKNTKFPSNGNIVKIVIEPDSPNRYGVRWDGMGANYRFSYLTEELEIIPLSKEELYKKLEDEGYKNYEEHCGHPDFMQIIGGKEHSVFLETKGAYEGCWYVVIPDSEDETSAYVRCNSLEKAVTLALSVKEAITK